MTPGAKGLNREQLKYLAAALMLMDHIINVFPVCSGAVFTLLDGLSHFTFVTMSFFLVQGMRYTHSSKQYAERLLIFALISQLPYMLAFSKGVYEGAASPNVLVNFFVTFIMLRAYESVENKPLRTLIISVCVLISLFCDCSCLIPISALLFHRAGEDRGLLAKVYLTMVLLMCVNGAAIAFEKKMNLPLCLFSESWGIALSGLLIVKCYNGRKTQGHERLNKWFFYIFYPAHLLIIGIIRYITIHPTLF